MISTKAQHAGLYIHIPFCIKKCPYCDFYSITDTSLKSAFIQALQHEMAMISNAFPAFDTLYIGGGTPSVFDSQDISEVIETAHEFFNILPHTETTMEVNPGTVTPERLCGYRSSGINRINIGVQSFQDKNLDFLGRIHSGMDALLSIKWARKAGFDNIGIDLIYGIPGQSKESWLTDLKKAVEIGPEHLSCYMLTYETGTPMERCKQQGIFQPLGDGRVGELFETTTAFLDAHGYTRYEVSNFAVSESKRSKHNQKYWSFAPYIGLGPGAHSFVETERFWNHRSVNKYIQCLNSNKLPVEEREILNKKQQMIEAIYLGMRTTEGIRIDAFDKKFGVSFNKIFEKLITRLAEEKYVETNEKRCFLTRKGMLFLDGITSRFINQESI